MSTFTSMKKIISWILLLTIFVSNLQGTQLAYANHTNGDISPGWVQLSQATLWIRWEDAIVDNWRLEVEDKSHWTLFSPLSIERSPIKEWGKIVFDGHDDILVSQNNYRAWDNNANFTTYFVGNIKWNAATQAIVAHWETRDILDGLFLWMNPTTAFISAENRSFQVNNITKPRNIALATYRKSNNDYTISINGKSGTPETRPQIPTDTENKRVILWNIATNDQWFARYNGEFNELIVFSWSVSHEDNAKIVSYLACKHGIPLDQTTPTNYVSSQWAIIWNHLDNVHFNKNTTCIQDDTISWFNKTTWENLYDESDIKIEAINLPENTAALWSSNGESFDIVDEFIPSDYWRIKRVWRVSEKIWDTGQLKISLNKDSLPNVRLDRTVYIAKRSNSADFNHSSTEFSPWTYNEWLKQFEFMINLSDWDYFTIAFDSMSGPGWVRKPSLTTWFKAGHWFSGSSWESDTIYKTDAMNNAGNKPVLSSNLVNFENQLTFSGWDKLTTNELKTNDILNISTLNNSKVSGSAFIVFNARSTDATQILRQAKRNELFSIKLWTEKNIFRFREASSEEFVPSKPWLSLYGSISTVENDNWEVKTYLDWKFQKTTHLNPTYIYEQQAPLVIWDGFIWDIAEIITYNIPVSSSERETIEAYLACKYGISLKNEQGHRNYINSKNEVIWSNVENNGYTNNIGCIHRDDKAAMNKKIAQAQETSSGNIIVQAHNLTDDYHSLTWSDNWKPLNSWRFNENPEGTKVSERVVRFSEKNGDIGNIDIFVNQEDLPFIRWTLQVATKNGNTDFSNDINTYDWVLENGKYKFTLNVADNDYLTILYTPSYLNNINVPSLWIDANKAEKNGGNEVIQWPTNNWTIFSPVQNKPLLLAEAMNGNNVVVFNNTPLKTADKFTLETSKDYNIFIVQSKWEKNGTVFSQTSNNGGFNPLIKSNNTISIHSSNPSQYIANVWENETKWVLIQYQYSHNAENNINSLKVIKNGVEVESIDWMFSPLQSSQIKETLIGWEKTVGGVLNTLSGGLAEIIAFNKQLTQRENDLYASYLYIKYGITTETWDIIVEESNKPLYQRDNDYNKSIAVIAQSDVVGLLQKKSEAINDSKSIIISAESFENGAWASLAANDKPYTWTGTNMPLGYYWYEKSWKVQFWDKKPGNISLYAKNSQLTTGFGWQLRLYISNENDFSNDKNPTILTATREWDLWKFENVSLEDGQYLTIGYYSNVPPTDIMIDGAYETTITENSPQNTIVGTLTGIDGNNDPLRFSLTCETAGENDSSFLITWNKLITKEPFDYETKNSYKICVQAKDIVDSTFDKNLTIHVSNVNEAPTDITLSRNTISENNQVGIAMIEVSAVDVDSNTFTYALTSWDGSDDNSSFSIQWNKIIVGESFDYETKNEYKIRVRATDSGGLPYEKSFIISVQNKDDSSPDIIIEQWVYRWPASWNTVKFKVRDVESSGLKTVSYAYSDNNVCTDGDVYTSLNIAQPQGENAYSIIHDDESRNNTYFCILAEDNAWNIGRYVSDNKFFIRTTPPRRPVVISPTQDDGGIINNKRPEVLLSVEGDTNIKILKDWEVFCETTEATQTEEITCTLSKDLTEWTNTLQAISCDTSIPTPNCSLPQSLVLTLDTTKPNKPTYVSPVQNGEYKSIHKVEILGEASGKIVMNIKKWIDTIFSGQWNISADWKWSVIIANPFPEDAEYIIESLIEDKAGNRSDYEAITITIDNIPPQSPTVSLPVVNSTVNSKRPVISGVNGEAWATIEASYTTSSGEDKKEIINVVNNQWAFTPSEDMVEWSNTLWILQKDKAWNTSSITQHTFNIDTVPPSLPTITGPNGYINNRSFTITGEWSRNDKIEIQWNGETWSVDIWDNGKWSSQRTAWTDGEQIVIIRSFDAYGNYTDEVENRFVIDTTAPQAPTFISPAWDTVSNNKTPTFTLQWEEGATSVITIKKSWEAAELKRFTQTSATGWSYASTITEELEKWSYVISSYQIDKANNEWTTSSIIYTVDTDAPDRPIVSFPANMWVVNSKTFSLTGMAEKNSVVKIVINGSDVFSANTTSEWIFSIPLQLTNEGQYNYQIKAIDTQWNEGLSTVASFIVDTTPPKDVVLTSSGRVNTRTPIISWEAEENSIIKINNATTCITNSQWTFSCPALIASLAEWVNNITITSCDSAQPQPNCKTNTFEITVDTTPPSTPVISYPQVDAIINSKTLSITWSSNEIDNTQVKIVIGQNTYSGSILNNSFSVDITNDLPEWENIVRVSLLDDLNNESNIINVRFFIDTEKPKMPIITSHNEDTYTHSDTFTIQWTAEALAKIYIDFNGQRYNWRADGQWDFTINIQDSSLTEQTYPLSVIQEDIAMNQSSPQVIRIHIDRTAPSLPAITSHTTWVKISSRSINLSGTTTENEWRVVVEVNGERFNGIVQNNSWRVAVWGVLTEGFNNLQFWQEDRAWNYTNPKWSFGVIVDTLPPLNAIIDSPINNSHINNKRPLISFKWEWGAKYEVVAWGKTYTGSVNTEWRNEEVAIAEDLEEWFHTVKVKLIDDMGNTNNQYATVSFTVDVSAPNNPIISNEDNKHYKKIPTIIWRTDADTVVIATIQGNTSELQPVWEDFTFTPNGLSEWEHTIVFTAKDKAGNISQETRYTFIFDNTSPEVPSLNVKALYNTQSVSIEWQGEATIKTHYELRNHWDEVVKQGSEQNNNSWALQISITQPEWRYTLSVWQEDKAWNISSRISKVFTIDTTAPIAPSIVSPANDTHRNVRDITLIVSAQEEWGIEVLLNDTKIADTDYLTWNTVRDLTNLPLIAGNNTLSVVITDRAGNKSLPASINIVYDTNKPGAPTIKNINPDIAYSQDPTHIVVGWENGARVRLKVNGELREVVIMDNEEVSINNIPVLLEWSNSFVAELIDRAGNTSIERKVFYIKDTTPPQKTMLPLENYYAQNYVLISGASEANAELIVKKWSTMVCNKPVWNDGKYSCLLENLSEWVNLYTIQLCDKAYPNKNCTPEENIVVNVDTNAPVLEVVRPQTPLISSEENITLEFKNKDTDENVYSIINGNAILFTWAILPDWVVKKDIHLVEWMHNIRVNIKDKANNIVEESLKIVIDKTAPNSPKIISPKQPSGYVGYKDFSLVWETENGSKINVYDVGTDNLVSECITGDNWKFSCPISKFDTDEKDYEIVVCDNALPTNNCSSRRHIKFTLDKIAPNPVQILTPANGIQLNHPNIRINLKWDEPELRYKIQVDGAVLSGQLDNKWEAVIPYILKNARDGKIVVYAYDVADNAAISESSYLYWWATPPSNWNIWWGLPIVSQPPRNNTPAYWAGDWVAPFCNIFGYTIVPAWETVELNYQIFFASRAYMDNGIGELKWETWKVNVSLKDGESRKYTITLEWPSGKKASCEHTISSRKIVSWIDLHEDSQSKTPSSQPLSGTTCRFHFIPEITVKAKDISNNWAKNYIEYLIASRSMTHYEALAKKVDFSKPEQRIWVVNNATYFRPDESLTRAEFLKMLVRAMHCSYIKPNHTKHGYTDIPKWVWYEEYVTYAKEQGWIGNNGEKKFEPNKTISRAEVAKIISRALTKSAVQIKASEFADVNVNNEFAPYIHFLKRKNIISGQKVWNKHIFRPNDNISRSEMSKIIYNTFINANLERGK